MLTGFLGAGKTTLLTYLLGLLEGRRVGVIQNESGKLGVDGDLLRSEGLVMTEINRGSVFCSCLKASFLKALAEMAREELECLFVESSGLADPSNIEEILEAVKQQAGDAYDFKGVICLIDSANFISQLSDVETVDRQLAHCHLAAVNEANLVDEERLASVIETVRGVNPLCRLIVCRNEEIGREFLEEELTARQWTPCEDSINLTDNKPKTISVEFDGVLERERLQAFLDAVRPSRYRIKGFFRLEEGWRQVDVVEKLTDCKSTEARDVSQLVFLSKTGPQIIRAVDAAWRENVGLPVRLKN